MNAETPDTTSTPNAANAPAITGTPEAATTRGAGTPAATGTPGPPSPQVAAPQHTLRDDIESALRTVFDPEIPVNIFDLGLVYEIKIGDNGGVKITMTLTAPACPVAGDIVRDVQEKVEALPGVLDCHVQLTFDPPWTKENMSEEAKLELGFL